jgi:hypothetical protein
VRGLCDTDLHWLLCRSRRLPACRDPGSRCCPPAVRGARLSPSRYPGPCSASRSACSRSVSRSRPLPLSCPASAACDPLPRWLAAALCLPPLLGPSATIGLRRACFAPPPSREGRGHAQHSEHGEEPPFDGPRTEGIIAAEKDWGIEKWRHLPEANDVSIIQHGSHRSCGMASFRSSAMSF